MIKDFDNKELGQLKVIESTIKGWVRDGIHPKIIATALNNAFMHGTVINAGGFDFDDNTLEEIYDGIEALSLAFNKIG